LNAIYERTGEKVVGATSSIIQFIELKTHRAGTEPDNSGFETTITRPDSESVPSTQIALITSSIFHQNLHAFLPSVSMLRRNLFFISAP
jgi:hypothetical protein